MNSFIDITQDVNFWYGYGFGAIAFMLGIILTRTNDGGSDGK